MQHLLSIFVLLFPILSTVTADLDTTPAFKLVAHNSSVSAVDGKDLWIHYDGLVFLDAAVANPRLSYQLIGVLEHTKLRRIRQTTSSGPGSSPGTEGNLNFGTSNVCCDYARLNFSAENDIPYPARTTPFYLTGEYDHKLVFGEDSQFERRPWYACVNPGSSWYMVYYNKPYYDFADHGDSECTIIKLKAKFVKKLPSHAPTPVPRV